MVKARIFEYDPSRLEGRCTHDNKVYTFKLSQNLGCSIGDEVEGEEITSPSLFNDGEMHIVSIIPLELNYPDFAVSKSIALKGHDTIVIVNDLTLCAEGKDPKECIDAMVEYLKDSYANALLNLTIEGHTKRFCKGVLWKVSANIAQLRGENFNSEAGRAITIKRNQARRNSPNKASIRYVRVLLVCALLVIIPCLLRTAQRGLLGPMVISQVLSILLVLGALFLGIIYYPKHKRVYLAKNKT